MVFSGCIQEEIYREKRYNDMAYWLQAPTISIMLKLKQKLKQP